MLGLGLAKENPGTAPHSMIHTEILEGKHISGLGTLCCYTVQSIHFHACPKIVSTCHEPDTELNIVSTLNPLILVTSIWGRYSYGSHSMDEQIEA